MSMAEHSADSDRLAGITDADWWQWFGEVRSVPDPWLDWLAEQRFPREGPLHDWLEYDIAEAIKAADALRLATKPTTERFAAQWDRFKGHHQELDERGKYRRQRTMIWRAAALKALCDRDGFQDDTDRREAHDKLTATMRYFWPSLTADGDYDGGNFWQVKAAPNPLAEYAAMVLTLLRQALRPPTAGRP